MTQLYHVLTPGDHYSPRTGSAIPTVVHGLASAAREDPRYGHHVVLDRATFSPRYPSAHLIEYDSAPESGRAAAVLDRIRGRMGLPRRAEHDAYAPAVAALANAPRGRIVAHNCLAVIPDLAQTGHDVIAYEHNALPRSMGKRELARLLEPVSAVVCVSGPLAEHTRSRLPRALRDRVHVVRNGVDTALFTPGRPATPPEVMCVGRIIPEKGIDVLLEAGAALRPGSAEIVIVGSRGFDAAAPLSGYERRLRELVTASAVPVRFVPFVDREALPRLLSRASVLVVPSRWQEPSALTAGEGLACGLPVVVSNVGGIPEVVGDAGIVVPHDDPGALAGILPGGRGESVHHGGNRGSGAR